MELPTFTTMRQSAQRGVCSCCTSPYKAFCQGSEHQQALPPGDLPRGVRYQSPLLWHNPTSVDLVPVTVANSAELQLEPPAMQSLLVGLVGMLKLLFSPSFLTYYLVGILVPSLLL